MPKNYRAKKSGIFRPKVIDLFCGVGGLSLAAARAGFDVICAIDNDVNALASHHVNFPGSFHLYNNIRALSGRELLTLLNVNKGDIAGVIGGPPCQGFSYMGNRRGNDPRNSLFAQFFRLVAETRPRFFVAENVPGILSNRYKPILQRALSSVEKQYEILPPMILTARRYGCPTTRTRVFYYGYLRQEMDALDEARFVPPTDVEIVRVCDALNGLRVKVNPRWQSPEQGWRIARVHSTGYFAERLQGHIPNRAGHPVAIGRLKKGSRASGFLGTVHTKEVLKRFSKIEPGEQDPISRFHRLDPNGFCPTLRAGTGVHYGSYQAARPIHPTEDRVITIREAARLQGFPDWFQFSSTKWHAFMQIGNSVSPILAEHLLKRIYGALL